MTRDPQEVVKVYSGSSVLVEQYRAELAEIGIEAKVVGTELAASFGSALPGSVELWVHQADAEKAAALIARDAQPGKHEGRHHDRPHQQFPHPTNSPKPPAPPHRKEPYVNPNPGS